MFIFYSLGAISNKILPSVWVSQLFLPAGQTRLVGTLSVCVDASQNRNALQLLLKLLLLSMLVLLLSDSVHTDVSVDW